MSEFKLQPLLDNPEIWEIQVNSPTEIFYEEMGSIKKASNEYHYSSYEEMVESLNAFVAENSNFSKDNGLVKVHWFKSDLGTIQIMHHEDVVRAVILKQRPSTISLEKLIEFKFMNEDMAKFLKILTDLNQNILILGNTGCGRIPLIRNLAESLLDKNYTNLIHSGSMPLLPPVKEGQYNFLHSHQSDSDEERLRIAKTFSSFRASDVCIEDLASSEVWEVLRQSSEKNYRLMASMQADSPQDGIARLKNYSKLTKSKMTDEIFNFVFNHAFDYVIQMERLIDGRRKIISICEVQKTAPEKIDLKEVYRFQNEEFHKSEFQPRALQLAKQKGYL